MSVNYSIETIRWWEAKRKYYNIVIVLCLFAMGFDESIYLSKSVQVTRNWFWLAILIVSNLFYFLASGFELTIYKYWGKLENLRWLMLFGGMLCALLYLGFVDYNHYYYKRTTYKEFPSMGSPPEEQNQEEYKEGSAHKPSLFPY